MPLHETVRKDLQKAVTRVRTILTEDFTVQCQTIYGIQPDGTFVDLALLASRSEEEKTRAKVLRDRISHLASFLEGKGNHLVDAIDRVLREQAFTILNRLCALRMCEERGLAPECVRRGLESNGFRLFEEYGTRLGGDAFSRYALYLSLLWDELSVELGVLFDRFSSTAVLFPGESALREVKEEINRDTLRDVWADDEAIGWVYQYFNPPEERKNMRENSQAPRNSRELAVRNQFFTPRYVVEFLTDNTLGRIWLEMRKGDTILTEECRYLVRRPNEVFLGPGEKSSACSDEEINLSQEELFRRPAYIEHRPKKDPRDLRILDPACGSGHFLLYAFDLMERIYEEAWSDPESPRSEATGRTIREDFQTTEDLRRKTPKLVVEHNLHGVDIDPRAVQIADLALWMRAQKTWKNLDIMAQERPRIAKSNIVTAEPMPGEEDMRREFTAGLNPRVLGQIVDEIFEKMKLAGEAGTLLKIEEEIKDAVAAAGRQWREGPTPEQQLLFPTIDVPRSQQEPRFDVRSVSDERFWEHAEDRILNALRGYAEHAESTDVVRRRLFAEDTARGFGFIDLCRKKYDVLLMNPPFGKAARAADSYIRAAYPDDWTDMYASFIERGWSLQDQRGRMGAITSSLFLYTKQLRELRQRLVSSETLNMVVELGSSVLDTATVDTALTIIARGAGSVASFLDLTAVTEKGTCLQDAVLRHSMAMIPLASFRHLRNSPLCYHIDKRLLVLWQKNSTLEPETAEVVAGNLTFDDERFVRLRFEVNPEKIGTTWWPYEKGGAFQLFLSPTQLVVNWEHDGREMRANQIGRYGTDAQVIQSIKWWLTAGITYPRVSSVGFGPRVLSAGQIFSEKGMCVFPKHKADVLPLLALLASSWTEDLLCAFGRHRAYENSAVASLPYGRDLIERERDLLTKAAQAAIDAMSLIESGQQTSPYFVLPLSLSGNTEREYFWTTDQIDRVIAQVEETCEQIDSTVGTCLFGQSEAPQLVSKRRSHLIARSEIFQAWGRDATVADVLQYVVGGCVGRWDIRLALNPALSLGEPDTFDPLPACPPGMLLGSDGLPAQPGHIVAEEWLRAGSDGKRFAPQGTVRPPTVPDSTYPLRISWDGVLVDDDCFNTDRPHRDDIVRRVREVFDLLWKDRSHEIEKEACDILGVSELWDYFRKPTGFFQEHLRRYSKCRRKAPIYWPLSSESGRYTLWIYYHRLSDQTLFRCVNDYLDPKIADIERDLDRLHRASEMDRRGREQRDELLELLSELKAMRVQLLEIAALPYKPNLNDGVLISAAPLWPLFRHKPWQSELMTCWESLKKGAYDWSHMAYNIWPDRVRETCRKDKSIAIAHGLEDLYEEKETKTKKGRGKKK